MRRRDQPSKHSGAAPGFPACKLQDMPSNEKHVLVAVSRDNAGITRLLSVLHNANCRVTVVAPAGLELLSSRFCHRHAVAWNGAKGVVNALMNGEFDRSKFDFVIIADGEILELLMAPGAPEVAKAWLPMSGPAIAGESALLATEFVLGTERLGLPVPEFRLACGPQQVLKLGQKLGFPLCLRPIRNHALQPTRIIENAAMLGAASRTIPAMATVILQRHVSGIRVRTTALMQNGFPLAWFSWQSRVDSYRGTSSRFFGTVYDHVYGEPVLHRLGERTGFTGFCGANWILERGTSRLYLLGFQPFPTELIHAGRKAGVDFAAALAQLMTNASSGQRPGHRQEVTDLAIFPEAAIEAVRERSGTLLLQSLRDAPFDDPRLLAAQLRRFVSACLRPNAVALNSPTQACLGVEPSSNLGTQPASLL